MRHQETQNVIFARRSETLAPLDLDAYALDAALRKALKLSERWSPHRRFRYEWEPARKFLQDTEEPRLPFSGADFIARGITDGRGPVTRDDAIWRVIEPVFRAGETYPLPRDISRADAFAYWRIGQRGVRSGRRRTNCRHLLLARQQSRWRQPRCELRLYCRGKRQSTRGGTGDVRTFAGASARAWLHRHAVQFCNFQQ